MLSNTVARARLASRGQVYKWNNNWKSAVRNHGRDLVLAIKILCDRFCIYSKHLHVNRLDWISMTPSKDILSDIGSKIPNPRHKEVQQVDTISFSLDTHIHMHTPHCTWTVQSIPVCHWWIQFIEKEQKVLRLSHSSHFICTGPCFSNCNIKSSMCEQRFPRKVYVAIDYILCKKEC